ncbi:MAG: hypothetical protein IJV28_01805 [Paludibacteraceae bacterium]|nr:hypothetical protein [Paludibacteraceae bacterium]
MSYKNLNHSALRAMLVMLLFTLSVGNVWGNPATAKYSIRKTKETPSGAGMIYGYRGGGDSSSNGGALYLAGDKLKTGGLSWVAAETGMDLAEMTVKQDGGNDYNPNNDQRPDGYKKMDRREGQNGAATIHILHMYFYAKPNQGYQFDGWFENEDGTGALSGSTDHYPYPKTAANKTINTYNPTRWDNGDGSSLPSSGPYSDFYYLRHVQELTPSQAETSKTMYAKFSVIPRHFMFVGTGFADVSYTAGGTDVGATNVESGDITGNIALNITYNADKYNFNGWQWSLGPDGSKTDIASTASATYTFVVDQGYPIATYNSTTGGYDYGAYTMVYIQPLLTEKVDYVAEVTHNEVTTSYASWDAAFAAAKADGVSGAVITLKKAVAGITTVQTVDRDMTLNLNGHSITGSVNNMFTVSAGNFTLCDNTPAAAGKIVLEISEATTYAVTVNSGAKLTMQSGGVSATNNLETGTSRGVEIKNGGTLEMTGGNIYAQSAKNAYALINRGTATIGGGNIQARAKGTSTKGTGVTAVAFLNTNTNGSGIATINGGTFSAVADSTTAYGIQQNVNTVTINNAVVTATAGKSGDVALYRGGGKILVKGGKYKARSVLNTKDKSSIELQGGIYSTWTNVRQSCATGYDCYELQPGADWNDGYRFEVIAATANPRVCKIFEVGKSTSYYTSLSDALAYANNNTGSVMSIIMIAFEHTLPAGNYTLPQRADLVVPYSVDQTGVTGASPVRVVNNSTPSVFRTLTLASGANMDAFGKIEAGGRQSMNGTGATGGGIPSGAYGHLVLNSGSSITLENGSCLYAWGFVTGSGEINARRGSTTYEMFQLYGWSGGTNIIGYYKKTFPITEYFIQNIEAPVKYHPGSRLISAAAEYVPTFSTPVTADVVNVIGVDGDIAMFLMAEEDDSEDTWVRKYYDPTTDQQVYEVNSSARLGSLQIDFKDLPTAGSTTTIRSSDYELPLTHNMKIHLLTGNMGITQSTMLLPGVQLEVDKEAILSINAGQNLYVFDDAEWGNKVYNNVPAHKIKYRPGGVPNNTIRNTSTAAGLGDAKLFVHGAFDVKGKLYTTSGGANIYSTNEDAGTIKFTSAAATSNGSVTIYSGTGSSTESVAMVPALLRNGDNSTTATSGTAAGKSFAYSDGKWQCWTQDGCFFVDNTDTYYAKPADYVALLNGKTENADHTYSSADETRTFILVDGCQWWEVELEDEATGLWHCTHPLNDVYYYHNGTSWVVKTQTVTWKNYDGSVVATYTNVPYKTTPVFNSTTPTRPMDAYYTYDFNGWSPALAPITTDMEYTAQYTPKDRKYTIVFKNEDGSVIETNYCTMGQIPVCSKKPSKAGYTLVWSPTIQAVTGDATYQATFTNVVASEYTVTFKNYNNTVTLQNGSVATGTMPVYSGETPTKPATIDQYFVWSGWEPALHEVDADVIYTPTFNAYPITDREYDIIDWTTTSLTINGNGLKTAAGGTDWKIRVEGRDKDFVKTDRNSTTRTLTIDGLSLTPDANLLVQMKNGGGDIESSHTYKVPHIYTSNTTLTGTTSSSIVYVNAGKLTISANTTLAALYIGPGAEVEVANGSTLTVGKLVLRTKPWATAAISGKVNATNVYYTRIAPDGSAEYKPTKYYQFGLPYECAISDVRLSDGTKPAYNTSWALKEYDEETRATNGADGQNWDALESTAAIAAGKGYEIFSSNAFYREYYFPVTPTNNTSVAVTRHGNDDANSGWNIVCSPLMSVYQNTSDHVTGIKVSWLQADGSYVQEWPEYIWPALPFSYQTSANGSLDFSTTNFQLRAPRRMVYDENIQTEWIHLSLTNAQDKGDRTSIFVHPDRFEATYETGIDVAKQSLTASRAIIYSSHAYGDMAFAGVADTLLESGVALTVYSPVAQELTFSLRDNDWLNRMEYVWLIDKETGAKIDLLLSDYSYEAAGGTTRGRFFIQGQFKAPQVATDIQNGHSGEVQTTKARKLMINQKIFIEVNGRLYDATGKEVKR